MPDRFSHLPPITDKEEAEIQRQIAADPDAPEITDAQAARAMTFEQALPEMAAAVKRGRGRPPVEHPKQQVSLRLDADLLTHMRASGPGWQVRANALLRKGFGL